MDAARWRRLTDRFEEIASSSELEARLRLDAHWSDRPLALELEVEDDAGERRPAHPDTVGPYRLLKVLAEGGRMAVAPVRSTRGVECRMPPCREPQTSWRRPT